MHLKPHPSINPKSSLLDYIGSKKMVASYAIPETTIAWGEGGMLLFPDALLTNILESWIVVGGVRV